MAIKSIKQYLERMVREYNSLSGEFDNYSPMNERYFGYVKMCEKMLHNLSDETLEQPIVFREFRYCGSCSRYNDFHHRCRDSLGNVVKELIFRHTEACCCFEPLPREEKREGERREGE